MNHFNFKSGPVFHLLLSRTFFLVFENRENRAAAFSGFPSLSLGLYKTLLSHLPKPGADSTLQQFN